MKTRRGWRREQKEEKRRGGWRKNVGGERNRWTEEEKRV